MLKELNIQKNENDRLSQEIGHLEANFKQIKVLVSLGIVAVVNLSLTSCLVIWSVL